MWRQNIEQAEEERKRHTAIIEEYKKVQVLFNLSSPQEQLLTMNCTFL